MRKRNPGQKEGEKLIKEVHHRSGSVAGQNDKQRQQNRSQRDAMIDTMNKSQVRRMGKLVDFFLNSRTKLPAKTIKLLSKIKNS